MNLNHKTGTRAGFGYSNQWLISFLLKLPYLNFLSEVEAHNDFPSIVFFLLFSTGRAIAQSDTLYFDLLNSMDEAVELSAISEITFSSGSDSLFLAETGLQKTGYLLSDISQLSFSKPPGYTVPVELTTFSGRFADNKVILSWTTITETNNYGFEIEKQTPGSWTKIGFKSGKGTSKERIDYQFDYSTTEASLQFRLKQLDTDGSFTYSSILSVELNPVTFSVQQNYPNPFNPSTTISYQLPQKGNVSLTVFDLNGREITQIFNGVEEPGKQVKVWNGKSSDGTLVSSGVYFLTIKYQDKVQVKKMVMTK